ncbi:Uncharacterised protein [Mycobacteroides abscessus]|nr:Uncharacterised protein [Mycobacteroides abscessus]
MAGTASRSPARTSPGSCTSWTTMSPLSQCLPTTRASTGPASEARPTTSAWYCAA